jgi:hypothetical protein
MSKKKKKNIYTLIEDVQELILNVKEEMVRFLQPTEGETKHLRLSAVGRDDRKLWYEINEPIKRKETPRLRMLFFYGHILEAILLYLAEEAGHKVEHRQKEVILEGVKGHIDAIIDGALIDVKSASDYSFKKFRDGSIISSDPFGYIGQISSYMEALEVEEGGFFAINKTSGDICLLMLDELMTINASERVRHLKKIIASDELPAKCHSDVPDGRSGNRILDKGCVFCDYKERCWTDANDGEGLRVFRYSNGYRYFTEVKKAPNVEELSTW